MRKIKSMESSRNLKFTHLHIKLQVNEIPFVMKAIFKIENILVKFIKYIFLIFLKCYNKFNEISFTYNLDDVLSTLCGNLKFLLLSIDLIFLLKVCPPKCRTSQSVSNVFYNPFLLSKWILRFIEASTAATQMFVHPTLINMAAPWLAMFRTFFSALT